MIMALDTGVTTWLMVSALLVMLMTPGVGFFYGGLVRKKNFISMIALSFLVPGAHQRPVDHDRVFARVRL